MRTPGKQLLSLHLLRFIPAGAAFVLFLGFLLPVPVLHAENWYVKPSSEIPIRAGQGTDYKILAVVPDGMMVELVEESDPWAKIRTPGGTEGWMLKRYLSNDPPLSEMVDVLRTRKNELETKEEETSRRYDELAEAYSRMEQEYNILLADRDNLKNKYESLQADTADVIKIKENLTNTANQLQETRQKMAVVARENESMKNNIAIKWFLAGGAVLILGWLIGLMTSRTRRKKSSLY